MQHNHDKWGNVVLDGERRLKGPLFDDDGAQKALKHHLSKFTNYRDGAMTGHLSGPYELRKLDDGLVLVAKAPAGIEPDASGASIQLVAAIARPEVSDQAVLATMRLLAQAPELLAIARMTLEWIDAVPEDVALPPMPGFDRDWADRIVAEASSIFGRCEEADLEDTSSIAAYRV